MVKGSPYLCVVLRRHIVAGDGSVRLATENVSVHRLVLEAFRGKAPEGFVANHVNGRKWDNRLANLEWMDARIHSSRLHHGARKIDSGLARMIKGMCRRGSKAMPGNIAKAIGVRAATIYNILRDQTL